MSNYFGRYITGCSVANFYCYPIKGRVAFASALEYWFYPFQEPAPYPQYSSGYFQSESCRPNTSEYRIFRSYQEHMAYPKTVREMIQRIMETENLPSHGMSSFCSLSFLNLLRLNTHQSIVYSAVIRNTWPTQRLSGK